MLPAWQNVQQCPQFCSGSTSAQSRSPYSISFWGVPPAVCKNSFFVLQTCRFLIRNSNSDHQLPAVRLLSHAFLARFNFPRLNSVVRCPHSTIEGGDARIRIAASMSRSPASAASAQSGIAHTCGLQHYAPTKGPLVRIYFLIARNSVSLSFAIFCLIFCFV